VLDLTRGNYTDILPGHEVLIEVRSRRNRVLVKSMEKFSQFLSSEKGNVDKAGANNSSEKADIGGFDVTQLAEFGVQKWCCLYRKTAVIL